MNQCINKFLNKLFFEKDFNFKRELFFVLPYLSKTSLDLRTRREQGEL